MAARPSMISLIQRVRLLINDPNPNFVNTTIQFSDDEIQAVMDETREDMRYVALAHAPTYSGSTISYLDYYSDLGGWEDDIQLRQWRINIVSPVVSENIVGHWTFAQTTLPPVYAIGKIYDVYRSAADLLERLAARWVLSYSVSVDGQSLQRSQAFTMIQDLAHQYRMKQRVGVIKTTRSDLVGKQGNGSTGSLGLGPTEIDYLSSGGR